MPDVVKPKPGPEHERLGPLIGKWMTRGNTIASGAEPVVAFFGTDTFEWLEGGFFVLHRVDVSMAGRPVIGGRDDLVRSPQRVLSHPLCRCGGKCVGLRSATRWADVDDDKPIGAIFRQLQRRRKHAYGPVGAQERRRGLEILDGRNADARRLNAQAAKARTPIAERAFLARSQDNISGRTAAIPQPAK